MVSEIPKSKQKFTLDPIENPVLYKTEENAAMKRATL